MAKDCNVRILPAKTRERSESRATRFENFNIEKVEKNYKNCDIKMQRKVENWLCEKGACTCRAQYFKSAIMLSRCMPFLLFLFK